MLSNDINEILLTESADDRGNAMCVYAAFGDRFLFCPAYGWMTWAETHWEQRGAESKLENAIFALLKKRRRLAVDNDKEAIVKCTAGSTKRMRDCKAAFKSLVETDVNDFDNEWDHLNVRNGILNLRNGDVTPHCPDHHFTYCLPVAYDPQADMDTWVKFLEETVEPDADNLAYLQQAVGYSFTGYTNEECFWYVYGPTRSGKGVFTETLLSMLPYPLGIQADFATFTSDRTGDTQNFDLAPLKPARLVIASESRRYEALNEAKIKSATGGDWIRCAFKYHDHFEYRPQFKIWLISNHPIKADVDDDAIWQRVKVVCFPNGHAGVEDKTLKGRLRSDENMPGVLRWVVEGAMRWFASDKGLVDSWDVQKATQKQREELDHIQQWLNECVTVKADNFVPNSILYHSYNAWCEDNGQSPYKGRRFAEAMAGKGFERSTQYIAKKVQRGYLGLILKATEVHE